MKSTGNKNEMSRFQTTDGRKSDSDLNVGGLRSASKNSRQQVIGRINNRNKVMSDLSHVNYEDASNARNAGPTGNSGSVTVEFATQAGVMNSYRNQQETKSQASAVKAGVVHMGTVMNNEYSPMPDDEIDVNSQADSNQ